MRRAGKTYPQPVFSEEDADLRLIAWRNCRDGYAVKKFQFTLHLAHRTVLSRKIARPIKREEICDHINHNRLDNRRENLRIVTYQQNAQHKKPTPFRGTTFNKSSRKWQAVVNYLGKYYYCGVFADRSDAAEAARKKRVELNFLGENE